MPIFIQLTIIIFLIKKNIKVLGPNIVNIDEDLFIDEDTLLKILPGTIINFEGHHSIVSKRQSINCRYKRKANNF